jgi:hypothetical protein
MLLKLSEKYYTLLFILNTTRIMPKLILYDTTITFKIATIKMIHYRFPNFILKELIDPPRIKHRSFDVGRIPTSLILEVDFQD